MTPEDIKEIISTGQKDGAQLFRVADAIYQVLMALNVLLAGIGIFATIAAMEYGAVRTMGVALTRDC